MNERRSSLSAVTAACLGIAFIGLAVRGCQGQREATRLAALEEIRFCRERLEEALDARRGAAIGPTAEPSEEPGGGVGPPVAGWAKELGSRLEAFRSSHSIASSAEDFGIKAAAVTLALAEGRIPDAERAVAAAAEVEGADDPSRQAELSRLRADARYDVGDWTGALPLYEQVLRGAPEDTRCVERVAECFLSRGDSVRSMAAYAELVRRLRARGSRHLAALDHPVAARDLNQAATTILWLARQGRSDLSPDLAASLSSCGRALFALRSLDVARSYLEQAIQIRAQLADASTSAALAADHAILGMVLLASRTPEGAVPRFAAAIEITKRRVDEGHDDVRKLLATWVGRRGLALRAVGRAEEARQDFEAAAATLAATGDEAAAAEWRERSEAAAAGN